MPFEIPPLGKFVIESFDAENLAYPIVVVARDPTIGGYILPAIGDACPDPRYAATHTFTGPVVTHLDNRVLWRYELLPGQQFVTHARSSEVRGIAVDTYDQKAAAGTLPVEAGSLVISSKVSPLSSVIEQRVSEKVANLPPNEVWYDYQYVDIPRRIFDLAPTVICNLTDQYSVTFNPRTKPAGSFIRKVRTTISYSATPPGDTALNIIVRADLDYDGKVINHHYHGVLNDAITFTGTATIGGCTFIETYTFPASSPSATSFSGQWWLIDRKTIQWGTTGWRTKTVEHYEP